jgi:hypothetical protein
MTAGASLSAHDPTAPQAVAATQSAAVSGFVNPAHSVKSHTSRTRDKLAPVRYSAALN